MTARSACPAAGRAGHGPSQLYDQTESRRRPDEQRIAHRAGLSEDLDASPNFLKINLGKHRVTLNLSTPEGAELAHRIVAISDAVVKNMRPGVMNRLGLGYQDLVKVKPVIPAAPAGAGTGLPALQSRKAGSSGV